MIKPMCRDFGRNKHGSEKVRRHFDAGQRKGSLDEYFRYGVTGGAGQRSTFLCSFEKANVSRRDSDR